MSAADIVETLAGAGPFTYTDEIALHVAIARALDARGIEHEREVRLDERSRIDFLTRTGVGIEVKVGGSLAAVTRQMTRYATHSQVRELLLVTTRASHHHIPLSLGGKHVALYSLIGQGL